jgi:hypothetical protein
MIAGTGLWSHRELIRSQLQERLLLQKAGQSVSDSEHRQLVDRQREERWSARALPAPRSSLERSGPAPQDLGVAPDAEISWRCA